MFKHSTKSVQENVGKSHVFGKLDAVKNPLSYLCYMSEGEDSETLADQGLSKSFKRTFTFPFLNAHLVQSFH